MKWIPLRVIMIQFIVKNFVKRKHYGTNEKKTTLIEKGFCVLRNRGIR